MDEYMIYKMLAENRKEKKGMGPQVSGGDIIVSLFICMLPLMLVLQSAAVALKHTLMALMAPPNALPPPAVVLL